MKVKENGMSLIALVVTIIVLILLAGVTISNIRNDSGLFNKSLEARDEKIASEENEAIQWAAAQAVADDSNKTGQIIDKGQIAEKLDKYIGNQNEDMEYQIFGPEEEYKGTMIISDTYVVEFSKSGNSYIIDGSGNVRRDETGDKVASRDGVLIKPASTSINIGSELTLNILANTNDYKVTCSDESVLQVKKDLSGNIKVTNNTITVKGLKLGKATIVVETSKEKRAISYITVHQEPTSIELSATSEILDISSVIKSLQIKPTICPSTANYKTGITWTSSNNDVAVVDSNGFVTGISNGEVTITATTENGRAATWKVVVISTPLEISLDSENLVLDINGVNTHQYATTIYPSTANASIGLRWEIESSSSPNVISISSNGVVTGLSNGTATVRVTTENNKTTTGFVTVQTSPIGIQLNKNNVTLDLTANPKSIQLTSTILPSTANVQNVVKWSSSNSSIATVGNDGTVIGVSNGTAVITATTQNGKTTKCNVKVQTSPVSLSLNKAKTTLNMTGTKTTKLYPVYDPKTSNVNTKLTWKSSDTSVATVDQDGNVTAKKNGTTVITATTQNNKSATCIVTVETLITGIRLNKEYETIESLELNKQTFQLVATLTPSTSTEGIIWTSSNSNVAVVNQDGLVIIKGAGKVTITVKSSSGTHSASCVITAVQLYAIVFDAQGGSVNPTSYTLKAGDKCTLPQASASGYVFQYWEYNGTHYSANTIFTMPAANVHMKGYWAQEGGGGGDGGC
ncbi:MAG: Ig-like domain-containing protein [Clostridium sp.]|nr:Ig-like domain-containing protein [Clostridium sp.]